MTQFDSDSYHSAKSHKEAVEICLKVKSTKIPEELFECGKLEISFGKKDTNKCDVQMKLTSSSCDKQIHWRLDKSWIVNTQIQLCLINTDKSWKTTTYAQCLEMTVDIGQRVKFEVRFTDSTQEKIKDEFTGITQEKITDEVIEFDVTMSKRETTFSNKQDNRTLLDEIGLYSQISIFDYFKFRKSSDENLPDQNESDENLPDQNEREKRRFQEYKSSMNFRLMKLKIKDSNNIKPSCRQYYLKIVCPKGELPVGIEKETSKILALGSPKWNETLSFLVKKENWDNRSEIKLECILLSMDYAMVVQQEGKVETTANELQTKRSIDFVYKWSLVLFDIDGSTAKVESTNLSSTANAVSLEKDKLTFTVEVLEVAGNEEELDTFKEEWEKGPRAIAIRLEISRRQDINKQKNGFLNVWPYFLVTQWSLVLLDTDGTTSKVKLTEEQLPKTKGERVPLQINGGSINVEVLEVSESERELDIFRDRWKKTNRATAIARETVNQKKDGFLNVDPVVPTWSLVLYDINGSRDYVESAQLSEISVKHARVTLTTGDKAYQVEVLEVADTKEELEIFNRKWIQSPRAKAIFKRKEKHGSLSVRPVEMVHVPKWSLVLFDIDGTIAMVESAELSPPAQINDTAILEINTKTFEVEVLAVAETENEIATFKYRWKKTPRATALFGECIRRKTINHQDYGFLSVRPVKTIILVNVDVGVQRNTDVTFRNLKFLCEDEQTFVEKRKKLVMNNMTKDLKLKNLSHEDDVPNIAIIGSGGGMRAVIGMCGALTALQDEGILDSAMYVAGLSGSAWYLLTLYANDDELNTKAVNKSIRHNLQNGHVIQFWKAWYSWKYYTKSRSFDTGKYFTITDTFGEMIGALLLGKKCKQKWSEQRRKLENGSFPLPLVAALHVRKESKIKEYHEWIEISPYEALIPKYGVAIDMRNFGDKFYGGYVIDKYEEQPIHFLAGVCGSAYAAGKDSNDSGSKWKVVSVVKNWICSWFSSFDDTFIGKVPSWLRGISEVEKATVSERDKVDIAKDEMMLVDAGLAFNSPYPSVLNPGRNVDIIISFDFSDRGDDTKWPFKELEEAEKWANKRNIPFPKLNLETIKADGDKYKEMYIFEDSENLNAPTILHFVMINNKFRNFGVGDKTLQSFDILPSYNTMKFDYSAKEFDELKSLIEYNVWNNRKRIIKCIQDAIPRKHDLRVKQQKMSMLPMVLLGIPIGEKTIKHFNKTWKEISLP